MAAILSLLTSNTIPFQSLTTLTKHANYDSILPIAFRVVLVGAVIAGLRKLLSHLGDKLGPALFPTAYIPASDTSYSWVMSWIAQDPVAQNQIKDFQLSTSEWREVRSGSSNTIQAKGAVGEQNASWTSKDIIGQVIPAYHQSIRLKHNGQYLWVIRKMGYFACTNLRTVDHIQIRTLSFQRNAIQDFLVAAHAQFFSKQDKELLIFHAQRINANWQKPVTRPSRPWSSVILPGTVKEDLLGDVEKFLSEKETSWYAARGIPHRRGYLFHGEPGAGKTTLATALASKLRLDIYVINPSQRGMDDAKLSKLFRDCPAKSIILIEDIDCIFPKGRGRSTSDEEDEQDDSSEPPSATVVMGTRDLAPSTVTLSGLLNAIDGVSSQEGCILIASTNHPDRLDPALKRAGRFDVQIPFFTSTAAQAHALFLHFFPLEDFITPAPTIAPTEKSENAHINCQDDLQDLADEFTKIVFPTGQTDQVGGKDGMGVSMAALQSYLLKYKDGPWMAVEEAQEWVAELTPKVRKVKKGGKKLVDDIKPKTK